MDSTQESKDGDSTSGDVKNPLDYRHWTNEQQYYWTNEQALQLIQLYKEYTSTKKVGHKQKILMWQHIAAQMRKMGYVYCTANHCATKYSSMIRQYRVVTENNLIPGNKKRTCFFYDALSQVYDYVPVIGEQSKTKSNDDKDDGFSCNGQSSSTSKKLESLIIKINDDKKAQEEKCLDKIELMHQEKMEMFSKFINKLPVSERSNTNRHVSHKSTKRDENDDVEKVESTSDSGENSEDDAEENKHNAVFDVISKTLAVTQHPNENQWTEPWTNEISDIFLKNLENHKSMWIDPTCKKQTFWELVSSSLSKETNKSFEPQEVEKYFCSLTEKYKKVIDNNSKSGAKLITCVYFKQLYELFSYNPKRWYYVPTVTSRRIHGSRTASHKRVKTTRKARANELLSLLKTIHSEKEELEQRKMERLKRMHDDKMKLFSSFLDVVKKFKN